jgi:hypothetical protein
MFFAPHSLAFPNDLDGQLQLAFRGLSPPQARESRDFQKLWPQLAHEYGKPSKTSAHYSESKIFTELYLRHYLPAYVLKLPLVLEEAFLLGLMGPDQLSTIRWMDLGSGPGTAFWGLQWWARHRASKLTNSRFLGLEKSRHFLNLAKKVEPVQTEFSVAWQEWQGENLRAHLDKFNPTHISLLHSLSEIAPEREQRFSFLRSIEDWMIRSSKKDGLPRWLLIVEPGTLANSRELASYRPVSQLLPHLPCTDARPCGALKKDSDWCHHTVNIDFPLWFQKESSLFGLPKSQVIFSYLLLGTSGRPSHWPESLARMVSQRLERKGQRECYLCLPQGKVLARAQTSKDPTNHNLFGEMAMGSLWTSLALGPKGDWQGGDRFPPKEPVTIFREE